MFRRWHQGWNPDFEEPDLTGFQGQLIQNIGFKAQKPPFYDSETRKPPILGQKQIIQKFGFIKIHYLPHPYLHPQKLNFFKTFVDTSSLQGQTTYYLILPLWWNMSHDMLLPSWREANVISYQAFSVNTAYLCLPRSRGCYFVRQLGGR